MEKKSSQKKTEIEGPHWNAQVWDIPKAWSLRDAATVPVAYLTAYYALVMRGGLEKGHKVLVHSGTGAVGLAAIRICLHRGCEVWAPQHSHPTDEAMPVLAHFDDFYQQWAINGDC